jgi:hypothetical protein
MATIKGGRRKGAGRPTKVDEARVRDLAMKAIVKKYGSEEKGFQALLNTREPTLLKWVFEHAYGKPTEKVDVKHRGEVKTLVFKRAEKNGD